MMVFTQETWWVCNGGLDQEPSNRFLLKLLAVCWESCVFFIRCHGWQQFKSYWKSLSHRWKCLRLHNAPIVADRSQQQHTKGPCQPDLPMRHAPGEKDMVSKLSEDMVIGVIWYPNSNVKLWAISRH